MYNAVSEKDYENIHTDFRSSLGISGDAIVIAFVVRLIPEKGILKLIYACQELVSERIPLYLLIAGDGELADQVEKMCAEHIMLLGNLQHSEVISLLSDSNIYCLPTDYPEGFPTAILEAAMCGCCIVATGAGGTKELIIDGETGCLLHDNDVSEIRAVLHALVEHPENMNRMGNNARQCVMSNYTWKMTVNTLENILEDK